MERMLYVDHERKNEIIANAIRRQSPCVITCRTAGGWQTHKAKFVSASSATGRLFVEVPRGDGPAEKPLFLPGERLGVSFRRGHKKSMFATAVVGPGPAASGASEGDLECVELAWPDTLQELQRRVYFRALPPGRKIHVRFWPGGVAARAKTDGNGPGLFHGMLHDLSAGGMRVLTTGISPETFTVGDTLGCSFTPKPRGDTLVLDATFRHFQRAEDGMVSLGFQFVGLETTERGRNLLVKLARVVTDYQRGRGRPARKLQRA